MGGILRMCMHNLESKDKACRHKGYKRYWVVTNVDRVAADIKHTTKKVQGQPVFTCDYARMYPAFLTKNRKNVSEVFNWHGKKTGILFNDSRVDVAYDGNNRASAKFVEEGLSFTEISDMLREVCVEVYFQQHDTRKIHRQVRDLPMGGKCSIELAN